MYLVSDYWLSVSNIKSVVFNFNLCLMMKMGIEKFSVLLLINFVNKGELL